MKMIVALFFCCSVFTTYSQSARDKAISKMRNQDDAITDVLSLLKETQELLEGKSSNTMIHNVTNVASESGMEDPCQIAIVVNEKSEQRIRNLLYTFHASEISSERHKQDTQGIYTLCLTEGQQAKAEAYIDGELVKEGQVQCLDLALPDQDIVELDRLLSEIVEICSASR